MHISEGVLTLPVLATGGALTAAGVAVGLKKIDYYSLPITAMLSAVFFVASLVHVPIGPSSVHLLMGGLIGLVLGWASFPAILVALALQAVLFQFGGLLVLGVNTLNVALPALFSYWIFSGWIKKDSQKIVMVAGFGAGFLAVLLTAVMAALSLYLSGEQFVLAAQSLLLGHLPVMVIEGFITAFTVVFLKKVRPALLDLRVL